MLLNKAWGMALYAAICAGCDTALVTQPTPFTMAEPPPAVSVASACRGMDTTTTRGWLAHEQCLNRTR